jgi:hypothetical protein
MMISELERKWSWSELRYSHSDFHEGIEENCKNCSQENLSSSQGLNPEPHEYETGFFSTL